MKTGKPAVSSTSSRSRCSGSNHDPVRRRHAHLETQRRTLPSGLEVVVHRDAQTPQACVSVWYRVGSSDERPGRTGFAHLFEHLFKSSPERLGGHHYDVLRRAGSTEANASTSTDRTAYHEVMPSHELDLALWIERSAWATSPATSTSRAGHAESVVRSERRQRYEDVPYGPERFAVAAALYPDGHPLRNLTIGLHDDSRPRPSPTSSTSIVRGTCPRTRRSCRGDVDDPSRRRRPLLRLVPGLAPPVRPKRRRSPRRARSRGSPIRAALPRIHRAWPAPPRCRRRARARRPHHPRGPPRYRRLWRRLVTRRSSRSGSPRGPSTTARGEIHVALDLRTGADPAAARAILDESARRASTMVRSSAIHAARGRGVWSMTGLSRRANILQRYGPTPTSPTASRRSWHATAPSRRPRSRAVARWLDPRR